MGLAQTFDPYGNGYAKAGSAQSALGFTGEQTDSNGFVFLRARYYQPGMGRFTQMDPSRLEKNPYLYGLGNPILNTDPSGLLGCDGSEDCLDRCGLDMACFIFCAALEQFKQDQAQQQLEERIKMAAVVITEGRDTFKGPGGCYPPEYDEGCDNFGSSQLGTITTEGVLTHDHFGDNEGMEKDSGNSFKWLTKNDQRHWLRIEGAKNTRYLRLKQDINERDVDFSIKGAMLLRVDMTDVGDPVQIGAVSGIRSRLYYAWVPGTNIRKKGFVHHNEIAVGHGEYEGPVGNGYLGCLSGNILGELEFRPNENRTPYMGDSGGGYFDTSGSLVGVHWGQWPFYDRQGSWPSNKYVAQAFVLAQP